MKKLPIYPIAAAMFVALLCSGPARAQSESVPTRVRTQVPPEPQPIPAVIARFAADYVRETGADATLFYGKHQGVMPFLMESMYLRERNSEVRDDRGVELFPRPVPLTESYALGDIFHDGVFYPGVMMRLDLYRDQMVVAPPGALSALGILIDPERFEWADLKGYRIIHLPAPVAKTDLPSGYYLQLNHGQHRILKKERFELNSNRNALDRRILRYYVEKDGVFNPVARTKGSVLSLFKERRGELKRFIRARGIRVRTDTERALVEIVYEYERLNETGR